MKKILIGLCLIGLVMSATYHLYGMKITVDGDLDEARRRAHLAQKLMFQTKMLNVNNLDIVQNNLRLNDGTRVYVLSQHGLDSAQIYVPPPPVVQVPGKKRWIEQLLWPAWEAHNADYEKIGYVIARGGGWKPPYEFIPLQDSDKTDLFEWGQWLENYEERPFTDLDEYLKPNFIYADSGRTEEEVERLFHEIPPAGTRNRLFHGVAEAVQSSDLVMGAMTGECEQICFIDPPTNYDNPDSLASSASQNFTLTENSHFTRKFTYSIDGETGAEPPEKDTSAWWRWIYGTGSLNYFEYDVWDKTYDFNANTASYTGFASGILSTLRYKYFYELMTCEEMKLDEPTGCEIAESAHEGWRWSAITGDEYTCRIFMFYTAPSVDFSPPTLVTDPNPAWSLYATTFSATYREYKEIEKRGYETRHSSVEDEDYFGVIYQNKETRVDLAFAKSDSTLIENTTVSHTEAPYTDDDWPFDPYQYNIDVAVSGEVFQLDLGGNNVERDGCLHDAAIRYYRVGNLEFVLGLADLRLVPGDYYSPREFQYFFVSKGPKRSRFDSSIVLDRIEATPRHRSFAILPDMTDNDGNQIYITDKVRLIRETVTYEEDL